MCKKIILSLLLSSGSLMAAEAATDAAPVESVDTSVLEKGEIVRILYTDWKGDTTWKTVIPEKIYFGSTDLYPEKQWLLKAHDLEKKVDRDFAMKEIFSWQPRE